MVRSCISRLVFTILCFILSKGLHEFPEISARALEESRDVNKYHLEGGNAEGTQSKENTLLSTLSLDLKMMEAKMNKQHVSNLASSSSSSSSSSFNDSSSVPAVPASSSSSLSPSNDDRIPVNATSKMFSIANENMIISAKVSTSITAKRSLVSKDDAVVVAKQDDATVIEDLISSSSPTPSSYNEELFSSSIGSPSVGELEKDHQQQYQQNETQQSNVLNLLAAGMEDFSSTPTRQNPWLVPDTIRLVICLMMAFLTIVQLLLLAAPPTKMKNGVRAVRQSPRVKKGRLRKIYIQSMILAAIMALFLWMLGAHEPYYQGWIWYAFWGSITDAIMCILLLYITYLTVVAAYGSMKTTLRIPTWIGNFFTIVLVSCLFLGVISLIALITTKKTFFSSFRLCSTALAILSCFMIWSYASYTLLSIYNTPTESSKQTTAEKAVLPTVDEKEEEEKEGGDDHDKETFVSKISEQYNENHSFPPILRKQTFVVESSDDHDSKKINSNAKPSSSSSSSSLSSSSSSVSLSPTSLLSPRSSQLSSPRQSRRKTILQKTTNKLRNTMIISIPLVLGILGSLIYGIYSNCRTQNLNYEVLVNDGKGRWNHVDEFTFWGHVAGIVFFQYWAHVEMCCC